MEFGGIWWNLVEFGGIWWKVPALGTPGTTSHFFSLTLTVLYESILLLTHSNSIKKAPMKTCSWKLFRGNFYYSPISLRKSTIGSFLPPIVCGLRLIFSLGASPSRSKPSNIFRSLSCGASCAFTSLIADTRN